MDTSTLDLISLVFLQVSLQHTSYFYPEFQAQEWPKLTICLPPWPVSSFIPRYLQKWPLDQATWKHNRVHSFLELFSPLTLLFAAAVRRNVPLGRASFVFPKVCRPPAWQKWITTGTRFKEKTRHQWSQVVRWSQLWRRLLGRGECRMEERSCSDFPQLIWPRVTLNTPLTSPLTLIVQFIEKLEIVKWSMGVEEKGNRGAKVW